MNVQEIFLKAIEKHVPAERAGFLEGACGANAELRAQVEALIRSHEVAGSFLEEPLFHNQPTTDQLPIYERPGTMIGPYKLLQQIGEGGFGVVFMAEQREPVVRKVALKVIKLGMDTREVIARFEAERQALAIMDHPNIARVLDAGTTESGRPYFAMELVKGVPVTEYCDKNGLSAAERAQLFAVVCRAIQHAHQKGVIHRDIKPSNILVTLHDGSPVPKVIDFGVAKAINQRMTEKTLYTAYGQMVGTPQYMSPEQAEMSGLDVDTRSDVYSLGVLLYELLTGTTPLEAARLRTAAYAEMQRIIREEDPPRPSVRLSTMGDQMTVVAKHRSTDPKRLRQDIRGELDWIVMKSLEKERGRRYESAAALAADVDNYLCGQPVHAHPPSFTYGLKKLVRRHRFSVAAALAVAVALLLGIVGTTIGLIQEKIALDTARAARREALREAARANDAVQEQRQTQASLSMVAAFQAWEVGNLDRAQDLLREFRRLEGENQSPSFAWRFLQQRCEEVCPARLFRAETASAQTVVARPSLRMWASDGSTPSSSETLVRDSDQPFCHITYSADGKFLAAGRESGEVFLFDVQSGEREQLAFPDQLPVLGRRIVSVAFSPDGKCLLAVGGTTRQGLIYLWQLPSRTASLIPVKHSSLVRSVAIHPDGKHAATMSSDCVKVWEFPSGAAQWEARGAGTGSFFKIAFSPASGNRLLAAAVDDGGVVLHDADSGELRHTLEAGRQTYTFAFSPDGKTLATACIHEVRLWDMTTWPPPKRDRVTWRRCDGLAFSGDGSFLATRDRESSLVWIWGLPGCRQLGKFFGAGCDIAFSPCGRWLAAGQVDVLLWDLTAWKMRAGQTIAQVQGSMSRSAVALSDGKTVTLNGQDALVLWNTESGETRELPGALGPIACSRAAGELASGGADNTILIWDIATRRSRQLGTYKGTLEHLAMSPDGRMLASCSSFVQGDEPVSNSSGDIRLWDTATGDYRPLDWQRKGRMRRVAFSPTGRYLASTAAYWDHDEVPDCTRIWDVSDPNIPCVAKFPRPNRTGHVAFSPDEKLIALSGRSANDLVLWDIHSGRQLSSFRGTRPFAASMVFSSDGKTLVTGSPSGQIKFLKVPTGDELGTLNLPQGIIHLDFFPGDEGTLITGDWEGMVRLWQVAPLR